LPFVLSPLRSVSFTPLSFHSSFSPLLSYLFTLYLLLRSRQARRSLARRGCACAAERAIGGSRRERQAAGRGAAGDAAQRGCLCCGRDYRREQRLPTLQEGLPAGAAGCRAWRGAAGLLLAAAASGARGLARLGGPACFSQQQPAGRGVRRAAMKADGTRGLARRSEDRRDRGVARITSLRRYAEQMGRSSHRSNSSRQWWLGTCDHRRSFASRCMPTATR
ncbi:unnamed protein product, partial [Urochloa humidicola]